MSLILRLRLRCSRSRLSHSVVRLSRACSIKHPALQTRLSTRLPPALPALPPPPPSTQLAQLVQLVVVVVLGLCSMELSSVYPSSYCTAHCTLHTLDSDIKDLQRRLRLACMYLASSPDLSREDCQSE
ncbi:hypothetical protein QQX98_002003 [Neonectria punicea]|uniref:Uncharacterized protein n=1 Tax=Neonectria punicea TaxID=979145 RepID=A0ABR1HM33_9HYPO